MTIKCVHMTSEMAENCPNCSAGISTGIGPDALEAPDHLALVAAAYRDAAGVMDTYLKSTRIGHSSVVRALEGLTSWLRDNILARTPADATAALAAIERAAYDRGVQDAVEVIDERLEGISTYGEWAQGWITGVNWARKDILALLTQEGR